MDFVLDVLETMAGYKCWECFLLAICGGLVLFGVVLGRLL